MGRSSSSNLIFVVCLVTHGDTASDVSLVRPAFEKKAQPQEKIDAFGALSVQGNGIFGCLTEQVFWDC